MTDIDYFEQGRRDCRAFHNCTAYAWMVRDLPAKYAMGLFWPPVEEQLVQFVTPLPKPRQEWIAGFDEEQTQITK